MKPFDEKTELTHRSYRAICSMDSFTDCNENIRRMSKAEELNKG